MALENSLTQPDNSNSEISFDDFLKLISDFGITLTDHLKIISDAVRRSYRIYRLRFNRADMEDIVQSIVLLLIKDDCRALRSFKGLSSLETWQQTIANHETIRFYRGKKDMMSLEDLSPAEQAYPPSQEDEVLHHEIVHKLTKGQRKLLELILLGLKTNEIAERNGTDPDSVSRSKSRLRNKIGTLLKSKVMLDQTLRKNESLWRPAGQAAECCVSQKSEL